MAQVKEFVTKSFVLLKEHTPAQAFCVRTEIPHCCPKSLNLKFILALHYKNNCGN